jgi:hypothetical protein
VSVQIVGHSTKVGTLAALRWTLDGADEAIICSAFVRRAGVHLITPQLRSVRSPVRLVATSVFSGSSTLTAMVALHELGTELRVANPRNGTFHPKLYVARHGRTLRALVGSANLTGGLISNVETGVLLDGGRAEPTLGAAWDVAEAYWDHEAAQPWTVPDAPADDEMLEPALLRAIEREVARNPVFKTLTHQRRNLVTEVAPSGVWIETDASRAKGRAAQQIPGWMIQLAWDYLRQHGELTNRHLVASDGLNVKRSAAVLAVLSQLPGVEVARTPGARIRLAPGSRGATALRSQQLGLQ